MTKQISINRKIDFFKRKKIVVEGDKSLSIRFILLSSLSNGKCIAKNLLVSEDVISAINIIKKLGIKIKLKKKYCEVFGKGLKGYNYKKNLTLDAGNSGTTARLMCAAVIDSYRAIKITGDRSLQKRDMIRIIEPLSKSSSPVIISIKVVFPDPELPTIPIDLFFSILKDILSSMVFSL